jgi:c-di-GMP-related signal transduction protein
LSRSSDIIRTYIEKRFGVTALEQTTDEIMRHTRTLESIDDVLRNKLKQILMLSDMVKFAQELPLPNENEMSIDNAFEFVNRTVLIQKIEQNENLNNSNI